MLRGTTQIPHRSCVSAGVALLTPVTGRTRPTLLSLFAGRWHEPLGSELPHRAFRGLFQPMRPLSWPKRAACTLFVNAFYRLVGKFYHSTPRAGLQGVPGARQAKIGRVRHFRSAALFFIVNLQCILYNIKVSFL